MDPTEHPPTACARSVASMEEPGCWTAAAGDTSDITTKASRSRTPGRFRLLDECVENCPATAAYGDTIAEAMESLFNGRFSDQKIKAKAVAISLWAGSMPR